MVRTETTIVLLPMQAAFICGLCQAQCLVMEEDPGDGSPPHERLGSWVQMDMLALTPNFSHEEKGQDGLVLFARSRSKIMLTRTHPVDENPTSVLLVDVPAGLFEQIMRRHASEVGDETDD